MTQRLLILIFSLLFLQQVPALHAAELDKKAPNCHLTSLDNAQQHDLLSKRGKVIYVDFWASWCPPCIKSFPFLNTLEHDFKSRGLQVIAINMDEDLDEANEFLMKKPANFTIVTDTSKQCAQDFGVMAMPSSYLIDRKGVIRHTQLGFKADTASELHVLIDKLLKEQ
ncbi:MAG: TlpA disulfide reductase family protein [Methylococcaceae bacterium]